MMSQSQLGSQGPERLEQKKKNNYRVHFPTSVRKEDERQFLHNDNIFCLYDLQGTDVPEQTTAGRYMDKM